MKLWNVILLLAIGAGLGCMASAPAPVAETSTRVTASPPAGATLPLILDRTDLRIGTTVQMTRVPTASELNDLVQTTGFLRLVVALAEWPSSFEPLSVLNQTPEPIEIVVLLPGYPPSREAAEAWNYLTGRVRLVVVADGPPPSAGVIQDLNAMRGLERVVANVTTPSRAGFERLQRPLSFRMFVE